jgi:hypothetical protein
MLAAEQTDTETRFGPAIPGLMCITCGEDKGITRLDPDLDAGLCDSCRESSDAMLRSSESAYLQEVQASRRPAVLPDEVSPGVYVGPKESGYDREMLRNLGITHILICCTDLPAIHLDDTTLLYHRIAIRDSLAQPVLPYLPSARKFITMALGKKEKILVHCNAGVSRSGAVAVDWMMHTRASSTCSSGKSPRNHANKLQSIDVDKVLGAARRRRPCIRKNSNFMSQLREVEKHLKEGEI